MTEPDVTYRGQVLAEWTDYNQHLRDAFYMLIFSYAVDGFMDRIGLDEQGRSDSGHSLFTLEAHINYLAQATAGDEVRVHSRVLGHDRKRVHLYCSLYREGSDELLAASEQMLLHMDMAGPRSAPFAEAVARRVAQFAELHRDLPRPQWCGRVLRLPGKG